MTWGLVFSWVDHYHGEYDVDGSYQMWHALASIASPKYVPTYGHKLTDDVNYFGKN